VVAPVIPNRCHLSWALWIAGYPEQAQKRVAEAVSMAMRLNRPFSIAFALQYVVSVAHLRREYASLRQHAENLSAVAREHGFPMWVASSTASLGRQLLEERDWEGGSALMREGLNNVRSAGGELIYLYLAVLFAEGCLLNSRIGDGLEILDHAFEGLNKSDMRMMESEIYRLRGEMRLFEQKNSEAEEDFRTALRIANAQGAKSLELRAANSLGGLLIEAGKRDEVRQVIAPMYGFFTEGFEDGDLKEARELLARAS
jgi:predicted ATPase